MAINNLSFVMASKYPKELAEFYQLLIEAELSPGIASQDFCLTHPEGVKIHIYKPSTNNPFPKKGDILSLCLKSVPNENPMEYLKYWLIELISKGASISKDPKEEDFGAEAWMADPDGNIFLVLVPRK